jgi:hypothetical protein
MKIEQLKPSQLEFISRVSKDGTKITLLTEEENAELQNREFMGSWYHLLPLSVSHKTFIGNQGGATYIVKKKLKTPNN